MNFIVQLSSKCGQEGREGVKKYDIFVDIILLHYYIILLCGLMALSESWRLLKNVISATTNDCQNS